MEASFKTREQVIAERKAARKNAKIRSNNEREAELKRSKHDAGNACKSFGHAVKELMTAIFAVIKFTGRDIWAVLGKFIQFLARHMNKAGNHMDWSDK